MRQKSVNFYQFLYHVTSVDIFEVKSWPVSTFCFFVDWELVPTLLKNNAAFYLVIMQGFLNSLRIQWIRSAARIQRINEKF